MNKLLDGSMVRMTDSIEQDLQLARQVVIGMDEWTKESLSSAYLATSASFFLTSRHQAVHIFLNLHQIQHPHTGEMLAEKLIQTLDYWGISKSKVLTVITDNGSNMVEAIRIARILSWTHKERETQEQQHEEADNTDEDEEDRQNDHDSEVDAGEDDNEEDDDDSVDDEADNMLRTTEFPQTSVHGTLPTVGGEGTSKESIIQ